MRNNRRRHVPSIPKKNHILTFDISKYDKEIIINLIKEEIEYDNPNETDFLFYKGMYTAVNSCIRIIQKALYKEKKIICTYQ